MPSPIRILTAVPICDGHDSAINTINLEFIRHGIEVIYLGYHRPVADIVRAAIQEDVRAIGISSYNGGHIEFFAESIVDLLRKKGADDIKVFGGGGGTITHDDAAAMRRKGVDKIFFAGTSLDRHGEICPSALRQTASKTAAPEIRRSGARAQTERDRRGLWDWEKKTSNARTPKPQIANREIGKCDGHRFHRAGWRGKNDVD